MAKHRNESDRCRIELLLGLRWTVSEIAKDRGRPGSTIIREVLDRRVPCDRGYGCSNRVGRTYEERGKTFLDALGIVRVSANEVTLDPILLGKRFKRHAEKVVMDRYGAKRAIPATAQK